MMMRCDRSRRETAKPALPERPGAPHSLTMLSTFGPAAFLALAVDFTRIVPNTTRLENATLAAQRAERAEQLHSGWNHPQPEGTLPTKELQEFTRRRAPIGATQATAGTDVVNLPAAPVVNRSRAWVLVDSSANIEVGGFPCHTPGGSGKCQGHGTCCYAESKKNPCCTYIKGVCCSDAMGGGCCDQGYECEGQESCRRHSHTPHSHTPHSHNPHAHNPHSHTPHAHNPHSHNPHAHQPQAWPTFATVDELQKSPWATYFRLVYSGLPTRYPLAISNFWMLHDGVLIKARTGPLPTASTCPSKALDRYALNDDYQPPKVSWIWHPYPYAALAANAWVEVVHEADPFGDELHGAWMLYTPGSGIYFNLGTTIAFQEHHDAYTHFNIAGGQDMNSAMSLAAAKAGYDSVQFLAHVDHVNYPCDTGNTGKAGFNYLGLEIVAVKMIGTYACGSSAGAPSPLRRGWAAASACSCDNSKQFLNCNGTPELQASLRRVTMPHAEVTRKSILQANVTFA